MRTLKLTPSQKLDLRILLFILTLTLGLMTYIYYEEFHEHVPKSYTFYDMYEDQRKEREQAAAEK